MSFKKVLYGCGLVVLAMCVVSAEAQFSSGLQGSVQDPSGAIVPNATVTLTNTATGTSQIAQSSSSGDFRFVSLAPGDYTVSATANGFSISRVSFTLSTAQLMNIPLKLVVATSNQSAEVTGRPPVLDTAETRTQLTLDQDTLDSLPLPGRNQLNLVTLAPGVVGLGLSSGGGNGQTNDNYGSETQVQASANGRTSVGNMYVVDGVDITSNITPGVLNLVPNPDTIKEATVQVNTFDVEYGRASSIVEVMTTRGGEDRYHFLASEYYTANWLQARSEFQKPGSVLPYHTSNISATLSGKVPFLKQTYFFTGWEPLLGSNASTSSTTYEDPQFTTWAVTNYPKSVGAQLLKQFPAANATTTAVTKTGKDLFPTTCGTVAAANIPCGLPVVDTGTLHATNFRNALQWSVRLDKNFKNDRVYTNYYDTSLSTGGPAIRLNHEQPQHYLVRALQGNYTHTFSPTLLNEFAMGGLRMEGQINFTGPFHVPIITVGNAWSTQIGVGKAEEDYVQHHYSWRDALSKIWRSHYFRAGYEGFWGDNLTYFGALSSQPTFNFQTLPDFLNNNVYTETGVSYNLLTGQQAGLQGGSFQFTGKTAGVFIQDTWKANKRLTLTYGVRWDNFGNPKPEDGFVAANFFYGPGLTTQQQVANGYVKQVPNAFNRAITAWSPRVGVAFDPTGSAQWLIRGGVGLYHDWVTLGNVQSEFQNPPGPTGVTFQSNTTGPAPILSVGTSDTYPFGFIYPTLPAAGLNDHGGIVGVSSNPGGIDPNLGASNTMNYTVTLERGITHNYSVAAGYSGSHSFDLYSGFAARTTSAGFGVDINTFPGSLVQNNGTFVRLNKNFGSIRYVVNGPTATYNAFIAEFKGRFGRSGSINASYTHSSSYDDAGSYPTVQSNTGNYAQYYSRSNFDVPNRFSMAVSYELPHLHEGPQALRYLTNGWKPSATMILQAGTPFTVLNTSAYDVNWNNSKAKPITQAGDYNADGNNSDLPNVPAYGYKIPTDRNSELGRNPATLATIPGSTGVFGSVNDFTSPNTRPAEGNEIINGYRNPGYANTDFAILKNNRFREIYNLQLRLETFNLFNRANLGGIGSGLSGSTFGRVTSQIGNPRFFQLGARFEF